MIISQPQGKIYLGIPIPQVLMVDAINRISGVDLTSAWSTLTIKNSFEATVSVYSFHAVARFLKKRYRL